MEIVLPVSSFRRPDWADEGDAAMNLESFVQFELGVHFHEGEGKTQEVRLEELAVSRLVE